ncbi:MAG: DUF29 family protein [Cyanobacteria bacterium J06621_12]
MEEIFELKELIQQRDYQGALLLVEEMEEMGRKAIVDKIYSYVVILLLHLIKQTAEKRTTKSWDVSIRNSCRQIDRANKRRKAGGYYLQNSEIEEIIKEAFNNALDHASLEAFEGTYSSEELLELIDGEEVANQAFKLILAERK